MFCRLFLVISCGVAMASPAPDFSGRWAGTMSDRQAAAVPIYLTISEEHAHFSGDVLKGESGALPIRDVIVQSDQLSFTLQDAGGTRSDYVLKFVVAGRPLQERHVLLDGTATVAGQQSTVVLYPVTEFPPPRGGFVSPPALIHKVEPRYTEQARAASIQGTVVLRIEIEETGMLSTNQIRVTRGLGHGLDEAAVECVRQWYFKPALTSGYAVRSFASVEVNFRL